MGDLSTQLQRERGIPPTAESHTMKGLCELYLMEAVLRVLLFFKFYYNDFINIKHFSNIYTIFIKTDI